MLGELIRIVKLPIKEDNVEDFQAIYDYGRKVVLSSPGCRSLQLCRDQADPNIYFTISIWTDEGALNNYRSSKEFKSYWPRIKDLLKDKPEAYSLEDITQSVNEKR